MKRTILFIMLAAAVCTARADQITISSATLDPGGSSVQVTISLSGTRAYTSYNMDITLPEGWSVEYRNGIPRVSMVKTGGIYPSTYDDDEDTYSYTHAVSCTYGVVGNRVLRVACISTSNEAFTANSGSLFRVYLQASSFAKSGVADIQITSIDFATYNTGVTTAYHFDDAVSNAVTVSTSATAPLYVNPSAQWGTCVLPFDADLPSDVSAYQSDREENGDVYFTEVSSLEAYTPYILHAAAGYSGSVSGTVNPANYPDAGYVTDAAEILHGAIVAQAVTSGYVLQKDPDETNPAFYNISGHTFAIPEGKCWLTLPAGNNAPSVRLVITEPSELTRTEEQTDTTVYDVLGQPVSYPQRGQIYIQNRKKYILK